MHIILAYFSFLRSQTIKIHVVMLIYFVMINHFHAWLSDTTIPSNFLTISVFLAGSFYSANSINGAFHYVLATGFFEYSNNNNSYYFNKCTFMGNFICYYLFNNYLC